MSTGKVFSFAAFKANKELKEVKAEPTLAGRAVCAKCRAAWVAVVPVGTVLIECPECHEMTGSLKGFCTKPGIEHWACRCGNDVFKITKAEVYCAICGLTQRGFD